MGLSSSTKQRLKEISDQLNRTQTFKMAPSESEKQLAELRMPSRTLSGHFLPSRIGRTFSAGFDAPASLTGAFASPLPRLEPPAGDCTGGRGTPFRSSNSRRPYCGRGLEGLLTRI